MNVYISNVSVGQLGSSTSPSWLDWGWKVSDGLGHLCGPEIKQLRWLGYLSTWPFILQKASLSSSNGGSHRSPGSRKGLALGTSVF